MHLKYHILLKILILKFVPVIHWSPRMDTILFETVLFLPHFFISMHSQIEHNSVQDSSLLLTLGYPKMNNFFCSCDVLDSAETIMTSFA